MQHKCDRCGNAFEPNGVTNFYGSLTTNECSPFMKMDSICEACWTPEDQEHFERLARQDEIG